MDPHAAPASTDSAAPPGCTDDALLGGRVRLRQPRRGYRVAVDAVLLAASVPVAAGQRILDVGCGVGAAALCLLARAASAGLDGIQVVGLEVQAPLVALARCNARRQSGGGTFEVVAGDVADPPGDLSRFDHVMSNPPYLPAARADPSPDHVKALATVESTADLATWLDVCLSLLRPDGTLSLVHRADRQDELVGLLRHRAADLVILPLLPRADAVARRLILRARAGIGGKVRVLPGLALHRAEGGYTPQAEAILRDAAALDMG